MILLLKKSNIWQYETTEQFVSSATLAIIYISPVFYEAADTNIIITIYKAAGLLKRQCALAVYVKLNFYGHSPAFLWL